MKEELLKYIEEKTYKPKTYEELLDIYKDQEQLDKALNELIKEGKVYISARGKYCSCEKSNLFKAKIVRVKDNFAFATIEEKELDIYIAKEDLMNALINDTVLIFVEPNTTRGQVMNILERGNSRFVGEIITSGNYTYINPDEIVIGVPIIVIKDGVTPLPMSGYKALVEIVKYNQDYLEAKIIEVLGHKNDPGIDILSIVKEHQVPYEFPTNVIEQADSIQDSVTEEDIKGREDYRDRLIVTIDGDDSKDFDDAIDLVINDDNTYTLGVYIADVSHYVKENNYLDLEAFARGNSVYLADRVIPMLPFRLSNGICSLNPHVDRLVLACIMKIDRNGEVIDYKITEGVINSKHRLTYRRVNALFNENERYEDEDLNTMLFNMKELADIVRKNKESKGSLNLDVDEVKIIVDEKGKAIDIKKRDRGISEGLIEQFMILANETVASHIYWQNLPCIYRVHPQPQLKKIRFFSQLIRPLGYSINSDQNGIHPSQLQDILNAVKDDENKNIISTLLLRSLPKAYYSAENLKHFGLASDCYSHFTSPIRRYSDLLLHRLVRLYSSNASYDYNSLQEKIVYISEHVSITERKAIEMEREVNDMKMAEYMESHIGEEFSGVVSGFNQVGLYVELDNLIEGFVKFYSIDSGDDYNYDEYKMMAVSTKGRIIKLGDKVVVRCEAASKKLRQIDFSLVNFIGGKRKNKEIDFKNKYNKPNRPKNKSSSSRKSGSSRRYSGESRRIRGKR
jgi:ribonuclease R